MYVDICFLWIFGFLTRRLTTGLAFNIITDLILALLPVPIIWALQMKQRVRIYVIGILSLGYL